METPLCCPHPLEVPGLPVNVQLWLGGQAVARSVCGGGEVQRAGLSEKLARKITPNMCFVQQAKTCAAGLFALVRSARAKGTSRAQTHVVQFAKRSRWVAGFPFCRVECPPLQMAQQDRNTSCFVVREATQTRVEASETLDKLGHV